MKKFIKNLFNRNKVTVYILLGKEEVDLLNSSLNKLIKYGKTNEFQIDKIEFKNSNTKEKFMPLFYKEMNDSFGNGHFAILSEEEVKTINEEFEWNKYEEHKFRPS